MDPKNLNPLLILGFSADADSKIVRRALKRRVVQSRLSDDVAAGDFFAAMGDEVDDPVRFLRWSVLSPLLDSATEERFQEVMADYPVGSGSGLRRLSALRGMVKNDRSFAGRHALGVLYLHEAWLRTSILMDTDSFEHSELRDCIETWSKSLGLIGPSLESEAFWKTIHRRAEGRNDARISTLVVQRLRHDLRGVIVSPIAMLVEPSLRTRRYRLVEAIRKMLQHRGFLDGISACSIHEATADFVRETQQRFERLEHEAGVALDQREAHFVRVAFLRRFESEISRNVKFMARNPEMFGSSGRLLRDQIADWLRNMAVTTWNNDQLAGTARRILEGASRIADSNLNQDQLDRDRRQLERFSRDDH